MTARLVIVIALVGALGARAHAQSSTPSVEDRAAALFDEGNKHFNVAEYPEAIAAFKEAYKLVPEPLLLYNIAQAYRLGGDCPNALTFYKNYLREAPDGEFAAKAAQRRDEMDACVAKLPPVTTGDGGATTGDPGHPVDGTGGADAGTHDGGSTGSGGDVHGTPEGPHGPDLDVHATTTPRRTGHALRTGGIAAAVVGVAAIGVGGWQSWRATDLAHQVETLCATECAGVDIKALDARGHDAERAATIAYVVGGVAIAGGIGLVLWDRSRSDDAPRLTAAPTPGGAMAIARWQF